MTERPRKRPTTRERWERLRTQIETSRAARQERRSVAPHLSFVRSAPGLGRAPEPGGEIRVATYNVHRWTGRNGRAKPDPARAGFGHVATPGAIAGPAATIVWWRFTLEDAPPVPRPAPSQGGALALGPGPRSLRHGAGPRPEVIRRGRAASPTPAVGRP